MYTIEEKLRSTQYKLDTLADDYKKLQHKKRLLELSLYVANENEEYYSWVPEEGKKQLNSLPVDYPVRITSTWIAELIEDAEVKCKDQNNHMLGLVQAWEKRALAAEAELAGVKECIGGYSELLTAEKNIMLMVEYWERELEKSEDSNNARQHTIDGLQRELEQANAALKKLHQENTQLHEQLAEPLIINHQANAAIEQAKQEIALLRRVNAEVEMLRQENERYRQVIKDLLMSADCTWEERNEGHDWPEACDQARKALGGATHEVDK